MGSALRYNGTDSINMKPQKPMVLQKKRASSNSCGFWSTSGSCRDFAKMQWTLESSHISEQATVSGLLPISLRTTSSHPRFLPMDEPSAMRICQARYKDLNE